MNKCIAIIMYLHLQWIKLYVCAHTNASGTVILHILRICQRCQRYISQSWHKHHNIRVQYFTRAFCVRFPRQHPKTRSSLSYPPWTHQQKDHFSEKKTRFFDKKNTWKLFNTPPWKSSEPLKEWHMCNFLKSMILQVITCAIPVLTSVVIDPCHGGDAWCMNTCSCIFQHGGRPKRWVNRVCVARQRTLIVIRYIPGVYGGKVYPMV